MAKYRNIIVIFILLTCVNFLLCTFLYNQGSKYYKRLINEKLETSVILFEMLLDSNKLYDLINKPNIDGNQLYEQTITKLKKAHEKSKNIKYLYTLHKKDDKFYFGLDTAPRTDNNHDGIIEHSDFNSAYDEVPLDAQNAFLYKRMIVSEKPYTDKWGTFIGVFKPIYKDNQIISLLCVEIDYAYYHNTLINYRNYLIYLFLILSLVIFALTYYIYNFQRHQVLAYQRKLELDNKEKIISSEAKMADIGRMMAGINHEINNPLQIIKGFSDLGKKFIDRGYSKEEMIRIFEKIDTSVKRVTDIIKFMKSLVQNDTNIVFKQAELPLIMEEIQSFTHFKIKEYDVKLSFHNIEEKTLICKKIPIQQVLINLIVNSIDVIKNHDEKWIKISYTENDIFHFLNVEDSGKGISIEELEKINKGYYTTKKNGEGSGLGLLLSKKIAEIHGGSLEYVGTNNTAFRLSIQKNIKEGSL